MSTNSLAHVKHIQGLWEATHVVVHDGTSDQLRTINFYAREVIPRLLA